MSRATVGAPLPIRNSRWARALLPRAAAATLIVSLTVLLAAMGVQLTGALVTTEYPVLGVVGAAQIFPGERGTTAFSVTDVSGGTAVDASNAIAFAGDGRTLTTSSWAAAFAADRFLEFVMNAPLPDGRALTSLSFDLEWATSGSTTCFYFEVLAQTGTLVEAHGGPGAPVDCVAGVDSSSIPLIGVEGTTEANGLRIRVFAADSAASPSTVDAATVQGDYGLATFTLYPVASVDAADTSPSLVRWGLTGP